MIKIQFNRWDFYHDQHACSRECVNIEAKKSGKTNVVLLI